ncbi:predicted protein [Chaetomium globosum CBS 148.51]|uniref:Ecp2 effector protein-like domain-containing protein n=1 Tax=Chaetomium globosum (strain ATCC 6205 / CBS 148.51 / DSM 1962 / NBRC 6347 / NRRL 1970) TaxID=306901 RepID=Q2GMS1_CHAGB|nr:uncharacterized protein CHGG_10733 [Chaetomium globosum CBS 148.51]EAQ82915.1 predicted protein [Chaetomium globosum CBS 148.51]
MLVVNLAGLALLAIFGQTTLAAPAVNVAAARDPSQDFMAGVDTSTWVSVQFHGKTITYNPDALVVNATVASTSETSAKRSVLHKRGPCIGGSNEDCCGGSSFSGTPAPWAWTSDCAAIRDWAYNQHTTFNVHGITGDYYGIVFAGSCAFGAGTWNWYTTYMGSTDIGDLTRDGINMFAGSNGQVGAQGSMKCSNSAFSDPSSGSDVFWKLQCNGC